MPSFDRRDIVPLLLKHYPQLADMTSDQIETFLNAETGAGIGKEEPNGTAFDAWRRALKTKLADAKIWPYTEVDLRTFRQREDEMKQAEEARQRALEQH